MVYKSLGTEAPAWPLPCPGKAGKGGLGWGAGHGTDVVNTRMGPRDRLRSGQKLGMTTEWRENMGEVTWSVLTGNLGP